MSEALMLKYRPKNFDEVVGQNIITEILKNSLEEGKYAPSYLLYGTRGSGKTSSARIIAKCLNCEIGITGSPCNSCSSCLSISNSSNPDIYEIDGASNRGIGDVRAIQEMVRYLPSSRFKVFIIDEAQMLTREAFNAFLKTLEEPPENVVFILATTDYQALPTTVVSRCQKFLFKPIAADIIKTQIAFIGQTEKIDLNNDTTTIISRYANGSMRDALTILEQIKYLKRIPTPSDMVQLLGIVPKKKIASLIKSIGEKNVTTIVASMNTMSEEGEDFKRVTGDLIKQLRNILVFKMSDNPKQALGVFSDAYMEKLGELGDKFKPIELLNLINKINAVYAGMQYGMDMRVVLEMSIFDYIGSQIGN